MIIKAQKEITYISEDEKINSENSMDSLNYISNLYNFINIMKNIVSTKDIEFLPSFKGKYICEKLGIAATDKENEMKVFKVESKLFLVDKTKDKLNKTFLPLCESMTQDGDVITFILK
jgi:hypothetical protein